MPYYPDTKQAAIHAINAYNRLSPTNGQQAALTTKATLLALFDTIAADYNGAERREFERFKVDMDYCIDILGISDANIAADNTANDFRDRIIAFNSELSRTFQSGQHLNV